MKIKNLKSTITLIKKHLIDCGCEFDHSSDKSNSVYLKLLKKTIRISDHFGPLACKDINIVVSVNGKYSVVINGGLLIYDKISELKSFMKNYCELQICNNAVDMNLVSEKIVLQKKKLAKINSNLINSNSKLMQLQSKVNKANIQLSQVSHLKFSDDRTVDVSTLTSKQKAKLFQVANSFAKQLSQN